MGDGETFALVLVTVTGLWAAGAAMLRYAVDDANLHTSRDLRTSLAFLGGILAIGAAAGLAVGFPFLTMAWGG